MSSIAVSPLSEMEAYPARFDGRVDVAMLVGNGHPFGEAWRIAGRVVARRGHGKTLFLDVRDHTAQIQAMARERALVNDVRVGDIVGIEGTLVTTPQRGELVIDVNACWVLAAALRTPPDMHHELKNVEMRRRARELDIMTNQQTRKLFRLRAHTISRIRKWLEAREFLEVETPVLQPVYGGATAEPFVTHHRDIDRNLFLRISAELYLKRFITGDLGAVYHLGKCFRNEGSDPRHSPEFTMCEFFLPYVDCAYMARMTERLIREAVAFEASERFVVRNEIRIDLNGRWERVRWTPTVESELPADRPVFVVGPPAEDWPLTRRDQDDPARAQAWELFIGGMEIASGATDLNDPLEQAERLEHFGGKHNPYDDAFISALEMASPPVAGVGLGIDRLMMLITGETSIQNVIAFPLRN